MRVLVLLKLNPTTPQLKLFHLRSARPETRGIPGTLQSHLCNACDTSNIYNAGTGLNTDNTGNTSKNFAQ